MRTDAFDQAVHVILLLLVISAGAVALISALGPLMFSGSSKSRLGSRRLVITLITLAVLGFIGERLYHTL